MKNLLRLASIALLLGGVCFAQTGSTSTSKADAVKAASQKKKATASSSHPQDEVKQLKEDFAAFQKSVVESQQKMEQQLQLLQQENAKLAEQLKQSQEATAAAQATAASSQEKLAAVEEQKPAVTKLQNEMVAVKTAVTATVDAVQKGDKRLGELESPTAIRYRGIKLTPGGYLQMGQIYRTHNANSDTSDNYGAFPLSGSANSQTSEFRISGRASRLSLKAEGAAKKMKMMGYLEMDFLGASPTSNESQTNSFNPRLRLAFGEIKFGNGWAIAGGQNWSMLQTTRKGMDALSEWLPSLIDNSYTTGFSYAREGTIRVTKELVPNKAWLGFSVENPETVANVQCLFIPTSTAAVRSSCTSSILGGAIQGTQNTSLTSSPSNGFSTATNGSTLLSSPSNDIAPDLVLKYAIEPGWGHYEVKAIGRVFHDRVYPSYLNSSSTANATNMTTEGGGIGVGAILPVVAKKVDVVFQGLAGKGIGRFGTTGGPDVTVNTKGDLIPVKGLQAILGIETHPTSKFDFNLYAGNEYYGRATYSTNTGLFGSTQAGSYIIGYGAPQFIDNACVENSTAAPALCMSSSQNRNVWTAQPSMWYRLYRGKQGTVQLGASYAYTYRRTWDGVSSNANADNVLSFRPLAIENIVMTSFRYYLP